MLKILKILMISLTTMVGSGCANNIVSPMCLPDRPELINISNDDKFAMFEASPSGLEALALNDDKLKLHIETIEDIAVEHNKQFKAECIGE